MKKHIDDLTEKLLLKNLLSGLINLVETYDDDKKTGVDSHLLKKLIGTLLTKAGKSRDDLLQLVIREAVMAFAQVFKQPFLDLLTSHELKFSVEFAPKRKTKTREK